MLRRTDWGDRVALLAVAIGLAAVYLPWYGYSAGGSHVSVNGFRASVLGDLFFFAIACEALLILMRMGGIADVLGSRVTDRNARFAVTALAAFCVIVQLVLVTAGGRSASAGMLFAGLAVLALATAAWLRSGDAEPRRTVREMLGEGLPD